MARPSDKVQCPRLALALCTLGRRHQEACLPGQARTRLRSSYGRVMFATMWRWVCFVVLVLVPLVLGAGVCDDLLARFLLPDRDGDSWTERLSEFAWCLKTYCEDWQYCSILAVTCDELVPPAMEIFPGMTLQDFFHNNLTVAKWQGCPKLCGTCGREPFLDSQLTPGLRSACESGWNYTDGLCFKHFASMEGHHVLPITWFAAEVACNQHGAHLATVDSAASNHMIVELIRERPYHMSKYTATAWIGLWHPHCSWSGSNFTWIATGRAPQFLNFAQPFVTKGISPRCFFRETDPHCTHVNPYFENAKWDSGFCEMPIYTWVCSKAARFFEVKSGTCQDAGLRPILNMKDCEVAGIALGWRSIVGQNDEKNVPEGCAFFPEIHSLAFSAQPETKGRGAGYFYYGEGNTAKTPVWQVCQPNSSDLANSSSGATAPSGPWWSTLSQQDEEIDVMPMVNTLPIFATSSALAYIAVAVLVYENRRWIGTGFKQALANDSLRWFLPFMGVGTDPLAPLVASRINKKRDQFMVVAVCCKLVYDLVELTQTVTSKSAIGCTVLGVPVARLVGGILNVAEIMFLCAFLVIQTKCRRGGRLRIYVTFVAIVCLKYANVAALREQILLSNSRLYTEVAWRILFGACVHPFFVVFANLLDSITISMAYHYIIPEGLILVTISAPETCMELWSPSNVQRVLAQTEFMTVFDNIYDTSFASLVPFLQALLRQTTASSEFIKSEAVIFCIAIFCLLVFHWLIAQEARSNLRLQNSESLLQAVSGILSHLCDAVVQLDEDLKVSQPAPQLAALLHRRAAEALLGQDLRDHMQQADKERLRNALAAEDASHQGGLAAEVTQPSGSSLNVTLRDAVGISIPCQLFHTTFTGADRRRSHVLGVNELSERTSMAAAELKPHIASAFNRASHREPVAARSNHRSPSNSSSPSSSGSSMSTSNSTGATSGVQRERQSSRSLPPSVASTPTTQRGRKVLVSTVDLTILKSSPGVNHLLGPKNCLAQRLTDFVQDARPFRLWMDTLLERIRSGGLALPHIEFFGPTHLRLQSCRRPCQVKIKVVFPAGLFQTCNAVRAKLCRVRQTSQSIGSCSEGKADVAPVDIAVAVAGMPPKVIGERIQQL